MKNSIYLGRGSDIYWPKPTYMNTFRSFLAAAWRPFLIGCLIYFFIGISKGFAWSVSFAWGVFHTGLLSVCITLANGYIADNVPVPWATQPVKRLLISIVLTIVVTLGITVIVTMLMHLLEFGRFSQAWFSQGQLYYISVLGITLIVSLVMHSRSFLFSYREAIVEKEELKRVNLASQYESLQNQVNPHFLFNSLNVLSSLVYQDPDLSAKFIQQLSQVYRYVLESQHQEVVPLEQELSMLSAYLFLLDIRFGTQLKVEITLTAEQQEFIPPLSLQMLVENAVKHNIVSRRRPLQLKVARVGEGRVSVWNNYQPKQQVQDSLGVGLQNIKARYSLLSGEEVLIEQSASVFEVSLPLLNKL